MYEILQAAIIYIDLTIPNLFKSIKSVLELPHYHDKGLSTVR